uniref:ATP synthase subunit a n=1 Tax=Pallaseopsis kessleri TaxID=686709 RepID=A0A1L5BW55_9CRUS|nr:ATP synthase F0 subunit 6 [Pallaseopsis kessleri]APL97199.1 ATP synthase F0 subunit 6 [Pallaseopsis kessleri]
MMTSLFSIFDPATPSFILSNWMSLALFTLLVPLFTWIYPNRSSSIVNTMTGTIFKEFSPLLKKYTNFVIFPVALLTFIFWNNLFGLAPYIFTGTGQMTFTASLSLSVWSTFMLFTCLNNLPNLLTHLIPQGTPIPLMPFMVLVETISILIRPLTLAVRLMANIVAGHLLIVILNSADIPFGPATPIMFAAKQLLTLLEVAVAIIQAYVFSVLVTLYAAEATS